MILEYLDFKNHVNETLGKFKAKLMGYKTHGVDSVEQFYELPSGTQLVLNARMMADGGRIEFSWKWVLAE